MPQALVVVLAVSSVVMVLTWVVQWRTGNAGIVDIVWTILVGLASIYFALLLEGDATRRLLLGVMAGLWSLRLTWHLWRRVVGHPEDGRYRAMREHWGSGQQLGLFVFFQAQAIFVIIFSLPQWVVASTTAPLAYPLLAMSLALWVLSVGGEALADQQLDAFKTRAESKGRTCRDGLWRYSRHPNYFFEWLGWFIWPLLAWPSPYWWLTLLGPALMFLFLVKLTGIPYTEKQALKSRGEDYRAYQRTTSAFFPWPPKQDL